MKKDLQEMDCVRMEWNELAHERDSWRAVVNVVMIITQLRAVTYFSPSHSIFQYFCNTGGGGGAVSIIRISDCRPKNPFSVPGIV